MVDQQHGFTLDSIIDLIIQDTDVNKNGIIDIDEARDELLKKWSNGGKWPFLNYRKILKYSIF